MLFEIENVQQIQVFVHSATLFRTDKNKAWYRVICKLLKN